MSRSLLATVGSNPLPVVVVARHLKPSKLWLLWTASTEKVRNQIVAHLQSVEDHAFEFGFIEMGERLTLREATKQLQESKIEWVGTDLNYTAGTKQMSVVIHKLWREHADEGADACYLGADGILYWDSGRKEEPRIALGLASVAKLHFDEVSKSSDDHKDPDKLALAQKIREVVSDIGIKRYLESLPPVYGEKCTARLAGQEIFLSSYNARDAKNFKDNEPWVKQAWSLDPRLGAVAATSWDDITAAVLPNAKINKEGRFEAFKILATEWLETWLAWFLTETGLFDEVSQSFKVSYEKGVSDKEFELDAVALRWSKIYTFSCTVDRSSGLIKSKALEAHHRTQRIGGDHAAFAVFSLSADPEKVFNTIREERWHGHDRARIFGIEHLKDTDRLRNELEEWVQR